MAKVKKQPRPKAETPKGFVDYFGSDVRERDAMLDAIGAVYHRYGFDPLETPAIETVEALGKFLPDVDRPNAGVFAWQDEDEKWLALRYDMTAPLARVAAQFRNDLPSPYRRYTMGPVWRNEKPGPGRFRQFYQCDADTVGSASMAADAEICAMLADTLEAVGIPRGDYLVRVNNRKVLNGVMEVAGLSGDDKEAERGIVLRAIDKLDRLGPDGIRALLGAGRKDNSGDFTEGAKLTDAQIDVIMGFVSAKEAVEEKIESDLLQAAREGDSIKAFGLGLALRTKEGTATDNADLMASNIGFEYTISVLWELVAESHVGREGVDELEEIAGLLAAQGYGPDRIVIDPSVVRGLGYYTGPVYEAELTFEVLDDKGRPRQFGSVAGGGRYDDLVKRFTGQAVPATGVSIGVDRLLAALRAKGRANAGIRAEVYLGNPKNFGNQLKYADKRESPVAIIQGSDEAARGVVQIKDLVLGAEIAASASLEEWKSQPAQREVPLDDLVTEVRAILDRLS